MKRITMPYLPFILLICLLYPGSTIISADSTSDPYRQRNQALETFLKSIDFNGAVLISKNGKTVYKQAFGYADTDRRKKLNTRSPFNLASVSKQFTATGIMILVEKKKLKLEDPLKKHLPQFAYAPKIRIHHLLHHSSGLPDIYSLLNASWDRSRIAGNKALLQIFAKKKPPLNFTPGSRMAYSNTGYIVLASLIEKISGQSFHQFMKQNIFKPLRMNDSFAFYRTMDVFPHSERVWGMTRSGDRFRLHDMIYCDGMRGDGNIYSSVEDLFKWDRALYDHMILKKASIEKMFQPGRLSNGRKIDYGFGWGLSDGGSIVSHGGRWVGFRSFILRYRNTRDAIIVLINCVSPGSRGIVKEIKKRYMSAE